MIIVQVPFFNDLDSLAASLSILLVEESLEKKEMQFHNLMIR